jgi:hypothetical protein
MSGRALKSWLLTHGFQLDGDETREELEAAYLNFLRRSR